jgi:dolichol kinase
LSKPASEVIALPFHDEAAAAQPIVRPTNYARSLFHVASGVAALLMLRLLPGRGWLVAASGAFFVAAWTMETARRRSPQVNARLMRFFAPVAHPHERHRVNSSTWYVTALLLLALFTPPRAAEIGVVVLAVADPAAGFVGRRFGRTRLRAGRSLEGTLTFLTVGVAGAIAWMLALEALPWSSMITVAVAGAAAGAVAELASTRLDDNFTIPVSATAAAAASVFLLGA